MKKRSKANYNLLPILEIFRLVLIGKLDRFPKGTWNSREDAIKIVKYLIESILQWDEEDIKAKYSRNIFSDYKLNGLLTDVFHSSPFLTLDAVYPNRFKPWELRMVPLRFWTKENAILATKWLIEEKLKWSPEDVAEKLTARTFIDNGLSGMLQTVYNWSTYEAIEGAYPGIFSKDDLKGYCYKNKIAK